MSLRTQNAGSPAFSEVSEDCDECHCETIHEIGVELRTENPDADHATFSREPYRIAEYTVCGQSSEVRPNNA